MPEYVHIGFYRPVPGLEQCEIVKPAYAIEYDCIPARQLKSTLEFKAIHGLFSGGQFNGSSGYEEAAAQGLIAGINAAMYVQGREPVIIKRSEGYIGVLIDDLVTKDIREPYRMMTSRAEYRLLLRQDNADQRLTGIGHSIGLISDERYEHLLQKEEQIRKEIERVNSVTIGAGASVQNFLKEHGSEPLRTGTTLGELIRRPELGYDVLGMLDPDRPALSAEVTEQVEIEIKYEGYIKRQLRQVENFRKMESKVIPDEIDYNQIQGLRLEAQQKLAEFRPHSIGQASRIGGVTPADVTVLLIYVTQYNAMKAKQNKEGN